MQQSCNTTQGSHLDLVGGCGHILDIGPWLKGLIIHGSSYIPIMIALPKIRSRKENGLVVGVKVYA
jgi:hypothetical protein